MFCLRCVHIVTSAMSAAAVLQLVLALAAGMEAGPVGVADYWPEVAADLSLVSWSHATNSKAALAAAIQDSTMMIEADIVMGQSGEPVMAHPPANTSDLTTHQFLLSVVTAVEGGAKKGIKLDFKQLVAVEPSLQLLAALMARVRFPVWLNADILAGPGGGKPVPAREFLALCGQLVPAATLSTGFTTGSEGRYTSTQLNLLYDTLNQAGVRVPVTLPARASLSTRSQPALLALLARADSEARFPLSLTLWSGAADTVDKAELAELVRAAGRERVYQDLPWQSALHTTRQAANSDRHTL